MKSAWWIGSALVMSALPSASLAEPVLLISIDGLRPLDVIEAEKRGLKLPNLTRFLREETAKYQKIVQFAKIEE